MTINEFIKRLKKFDKNTEVIIRVDGRCNSEFFPPLKDGFKITQHINKEPGEEWNFIVIED